MGTPAQDEERDRVQRSRDMVADWQSYYAKEGFSGGVRMTVETQDGIVESSERRWGSPVARRIIAAPLDNPAVQSHIIQAAPKSAPELTPRPVHITQPESWFRRFVNYLWKETSS